MSLVVGATSSLLLFAHASKTVRTYSAHTYAIHQTPSPWYVYPIPVYWPGYVAFSYQYLSFRGCAPHTFPHTKSGISPGAVMSVVGELISVQAAQNNSNRGRPKNKIHDPHHLPPKTKQNGTEPKSAVRIALQLATNKTSQAKKTYL